MVEVSRDEEGDVKELEKRNERVMSSTGLQAPVRRCRSLPKARTSSPILTPRRRVDPLSRTQTQLITPARKPDDEPDSDPEKTPGSPEIDATAARSEMTPDELAAVRAEAKRPGGCCGFYRGTLPKELLPEQLNTKTVPRALEKAGCILRNFDYHMYGSTFNADKKRAVHKLLGTADQILREGVKIQCVEACFVAILLTQKLRTVTRFGISFESRTPEAKTYRHLVLGLRYDARYGTLGISRNPGLMTKKLEFKSLKDLISDFTRHYQNDGHTVVAVTFSKPIPHGQGVNSVVHWNFFTVQLTGNPEGVRQDLEKYEKRLEGDCWTEVQPLSPKVKKANQKQQPWAAAAVVAATCVAAACTPLPPSGRRRPRQRSRTTTPRRKIPQESKKLPPPPPPYDSCFTVVVVTAAAAAASSAAHVGAIRTAAVAAGVVGAAAAAAAAEVAATPVCSEVSPLVAAVLAAAAASVSAARMQKRRNLQHRRTAATAAVSAAAVVAAAASSELALVPRPPTPSPSLPPVMPVESMTPTAPIPAPPVHLPAVRKACFPFKKSTSASDVLAKVLRAPHGSVALAAAESAMRIALEAEEYEARQFRASVMKAEKEGLVELGAGAPRTNLLTATEEMWKQVKTKREFKKDVGYTRAQVEAYVLEQRRLEKDCFRRLPPEEDAPPPPLPPLLTLDVALPHLQRATLSLLCRAETTGHHTFSQVAPRHMYIHRPRNGRRELHSPEWYCASLAKRWRRCGGVVVLQTVQGDPCPRTPAWCDVFVTLRRSVQVLFVAAITSATSVEAAVGDDMGYFTVSPLVQACTEVEEQLSLLHADYSCLPSGRVSCTSVPLRLRLSTFSDYPISLHSIHIFVDDAPQLVQTSGLFTSACSPTGKGCTQCYDDELL